MNQNFFLDSLPICIYILKKVYKYPGILRIGNELMNADRSKRLEKKGEKKKGCFHTFYLPVFISPVPFSPPPPPPPSPPIIPSSPSSARCAPPHSPLRLPRHSAAPLFSSFFLHFLPFILFIFYRFSPLLPAVPRRSS